MATAEPTELAALKMTVAKPSEEIERRVKALVATDAQFRAALPIASVNEAKLRPDLGLAQVVALIMEAYAARPALARRATEIVTDPATGSTTRRLAATVRDDQLSRALVTGARVGERVASRRPKTPARQSVPLHSRVCWHRLCNRRSGCHPQRRCRRSDTNERRHAATVGHHQGGGAEWSATSLESLNTAVELVLTGHRPDRPAGVRLSPGSRLRARNVHGGAGEARRGWLARPAGHLARNARARREARSPHRCSRSPQPTSGFARSTTRRAARACRRAPCIRSSW